jgi:hypothetical protein
MKKWFYHRLQRNKEQRVGHQKMTTITACKESLQNSQPESLPKYDVLYWTDHEDHEDIYFYLVEMI